MPVSLSGGNGEESRSSDTVTGSREPTLQEKEGQSRRHAKDPHALSDRRAGWPGTGLPRSAGDSAPLPSSAGRGIGRR